MGFLDGISQSGYRRSDSVGLSDADGPSCGAPACRQSRGAGVLPFRKTRAEIRLRCVIPAQLRTNSVKVVIYTISVSLCRARRFALGSINAARHFSHSPRSHAPVSVALRRGRRCGPRPWKSHLVRESNDWRRRKKRPFRRLDRRCCPSPHAGRGASGSIIMGMDGRHGLPHRMFKRFRQS
jgi:hypothetical protein